MKPLKARITEGILSAAGKAPIVFSRRLSEAGKYFLLESKGELDFDEDPTETASLFDFSCDWKAIGVVVQIDHNELSAIHNWIKGSASTGWYAPERDSEVFETKFSGGLSYRNLGWININKQKSVAAIASIEILESCCSNCYVSIQKLAHGFTYLSLYMLLSESAKKELFSSDVRHIEKYRCFQSLNPFSKGFKIIEHHDRHNGIERYIYGHVEKIVKDAKQSSVYILEMLGLHKKVDDLVVVADICRNDVAPYFVEADVGALSERRGEEKHRVIIERYRGYMNDEISSDPNENSCRQRFSSELGVDRIFIKSQNDNAVDQFKDFRNTGMALYDSHLFTSMLIDVDKKFDSVSEFSNGVSLRSKKEVARRYKILLNSKVKLDSLRENIKAIEGSIGWACDGRYAEYSKRVIKWQAKKVDELQLAIEKRRLHSGDELQYRNLLFQKKKFLSCSVSCVSSNWYCLLSN